MKQGFTMKFLTENKRAAAIALVAAVLLSLIGGTARSISRLESSLIADYKNSEAASDMAVLIDSASQVNYVYKSVLGADAASDEVDAILQSLSPSPSPIGLDGDTVSKLKNNTAVFFNTLAVSEKMTEAQEKSAKRYYYDLLNAWHMLCENEAYAKAAHKYNSAAIGIPLRFFGLQPAAEFGL